MLKKIVAAVVSTVVTAYITKFVTEALERKPLKTRVREGKEKAMEMKDTAMQKAADVKMAAQEKAAEMKIKAQVKADELIEEKDHVKVEVDNKDRNGF